LGVVDEPLSQLVTNSSNKAGSALHMSDLLGSLRKGATNEVVCRNTKEDWPL